MHSYRIKGLHLCELCVNPTNHGLLKPFFNKTYVNAASIRKPLGTWSDRVACIKNRVNKNILNNVVQLSYLMQEIRAEMLPMATIQFLFENSTKEESITLLL